MATLTIRKLDDGVYNRLGERARRNHRSLEAEVRDILERKAREFDLQRWLERARELRERTPPREDGRTSIDLLREERDSW
jgi:plasmid stability protein